MGEEKLRTAKRLLEEYSEESSCGWCQRTGTKLATAVGEFSEATPAATTFKDTHSGAGELGRIDDTVVELKETRLQNDEFRNRLNDVLRKTEEVVDRAGTMPRPPKVPRTPALPGLVTPDQIGAQRDAEYAKFKQEVHRPGGPIINRLRFTVWKLTDPEKPGPLQRRRNLNG